MGIMPDMLPGYQSYDEDRSKFEKLWQRGIPKEKGKSASEIIEAMDKEEIKALYVMGVDPLMSFPNSSKIEKAIGKLDFLLVQELFLTEIAKEASLVLPAVSFAEKEGTFTNVWGSVQPIRKGIENYRNALPDWQIITEISKRLGYPMEYQNASQISKEILELVPSYGGQCQNSVVGVSGQCHRHRYPTPIPKEGRPKQFNFFPFLEVEEEEDKRYTLLTGTLPLHSGILSTYSGGLNLIYPEGWIEINPQDAKDLGIGEGETVTLSSSQGEIRTKVKIVSRLPQGILFAPNHFKEPRVNCLTKDSNFVEVELKR